MALFYSVPQCQAIMEEVVLETLSRKVCLAESNLQEMLTAQLGKLIKHSLIDFGIIADAVMVVGCFGYVVLVYSYRLSYLRMFCLGNRWSKRAVIFHQPMTSQ